MNTPKAGFSLTSAFRNLIIAVPAIAGIVKEFATDFFKQPVINESPNLFSWDWSIQNGMKGIGVVLAGWKLLPGSIQGMIVSFILYRVWSACRKKGPEELGGNHVTVYNNPMVDSSRFAQEVVKEFFDQLPEFMQRQQRLLEQK